MLASSFGPDKGEGKGKAPCCNMKQFPSFLPSFLFGRKEGRRGEKAEETRLIAREPGNETTTERPDKMRPHAACLHGEWEREFSIIFWRCDM